MTQDIKILGSTTTSAPSSLGYRQPAVSFTGGRSKFFVGDSTNTAQEINSPANVIGITPSTSNAHQVVTIKGDGSGFETKNDVPTYTSTARDALTNVPTNHIIYNSTAASFQKYNGATWDNIGGGGGGGTPGGSDTQVQFNDGGSFGGDAGFTYDKTTDSLTLAGNQTFSGSAKRIKGDLSNATRSNRVSFQTSTTDSNTLVQAIPSGTGTLSGFLAYGASDPDNSAYLQVHAEDSVHVGLNAGKSGTGTTQDLVFQIDGTTKAKVNAADGKFNVDTLTASQIVATDASKNLQTLPVASYPSLAELAYVKGVTSAIQTQINAKQNTLTSAVLGALIDGLTDKATPVDADELAISDSAASSVAKKLTWANLKATLKTFFDSLYQPKGVSINAIITESTTARTLALTDAGCYIRTTNSGATTITVPNNADVPFLIGTGINVLQAGTGQVSFVASTSGATVTLNSQPGLKISAQFKSVSLIKVGTNEWDLVGSLNA